VDVTTLVFQPRIDATVVILVVIAIGMHAPIAGLHHWAAAGFATCLILALAFRLNGAVHSALLATLAVVMATIPLLSQTIGPLPVLPLLIPLVISTLLIAMSRETRSELSWLRLGEVTMSMWLLVGATGIVSAVGLVVWALWTDNFGIGAQMVAGVSHLPVVALVLIVIPMFAAFNAVTEETIFRGVLYTSVARSSQSVWFANVVQAVAFAALHFEMGFPNGWVGYGMLTVYALVLGYLRIQTGGLLASVVAHIIADLVIGYIVLFAPMMS